MVDWASAFYLFIYLFIYLFYLLIDIRLSLKNWQLVVILVVTIKGKGL